MQGRKQRRKIDGLVPGLAIGKPGQADRNVGQALPHQIDFLQGKQIWAGGPGFARSIGPGFGSGFDQGHHQILDPHDRRFAAGKDRCCAAEQLGGAEQIPVLHRDQSRPTTVSIAERSVTVVKGLRTMLFSPSP